DWTSLGHSDGQVRVEARPLWLDLWRSTMPQPPGETATGKHAPQRAKPGQRFESLIGRTDEVRQIEAALGRAADGRGEALFLVEAPAIGKHRRAAEALALARRAGFRALDGRAYPLEGGLAYAPLLDAMGPLLRSLEPGQRNRLVRGLPNLGRLFADLDLP